MFVLLEVMY